MSNPPSCIQRPGDQKSLDCLTFEPLSVLIGSPGLVGGFLRFSFIGGSFLIAFTPAHMRLAILSVDTNLYFTRMIIWVTLNKYKDSTCELDVDEDERNRTGKV